MSGWWDWAGGVMLPVAPSRATLLEGKLTAQGVTIHTTEFGAMPWWPACWAWLNPQSRQEAAAQLLAMGEQLILIAYPDGRALYDEPGQFYSADKFPAKSITMAAFGDLVVEALALGFQGCHLFLGGDTDFNESNAQVQELGPLFAARPEGNLNDYCLVLPGWDGVWHAPGGVYTRDELRAFSLNARAAGVKYVGCEHGTGYGLAGDGAGGDYEPGGVMSAYDAIFGEFDDGRFDDTVWQILARYLGPAYVRPPEQPANDDPPPTPWWIGGLNELGQPYVYRVFEFAMYGAVRGTSNATIQTWRQKFYAYGARVIS